MREVSVIGVGMHKFAKVPHLCLEDLGRVACERALEDASINRKEIQAVYCGNFLNEVQPGQRVAYEAGITGVPTFNFRNGCASGSTAFWNGFKAVATGVFDIVLVVGVESMTPTIKGVIPFSGGHPMLLGDLGVYMPSFFALLARRHMVDYGTTVEQLAKVSVKNHRYGALNPDAQYQKEVTIEEVRNSPMVSDPLTLLDCCPIGDGAAAAIICSSDLARKYTNKPVKVLSSAFVTARYRGSGASMTVSDVTRVAAEKAYKEAGITPTDIDVLECHDCFSITEIMIYDGLYLCEKGQGGRLIDEGMTEINGKWPTNLSGGLLAKGHPIGATGVAQIAEIVWQLRGEAGRRQVPNKHKIGVAHNYGGFPGAVSECQIGGGDFGNCVVTVMSR